MGTKFKPISQVSPPFRILSANGGGIYGLYTAIALRKLCEKNKDFLKAGQLDLITGTSAGALITLMLAMKENPREAALSGELEDMFKNSLLYSNKLDKFQEVTSLMGLTAWSGRKDTMKLYDQYFGDTTIGELNSRVIIATFDFVGRKKGFWAPKLFDNYSPGCQSDLKVKDLAYYATSPATLRPVVDGYSDAGIFADNPAINAVAQVIAESSLEARCPDSLWDIFDLLRKQLTTAQEHVLEDKITFMDFKDTCAAVGKGIQDELGTLKYNTDKSVDHSFAVSLVSLMDTKPGDKISRKDLMTLVREQVDAELDFTNDAILTAIEMNEDYQNRIRLKVDGFRALFESTLTKLSARNGSGKAALPPLFANKKSFYKYMFDGTGRTLGDIQLLSMGIGAFVPSYHTANFNLGVLPFVLTPTNIAQAAFASPAFNIFFEPTTEDTFQELANLLGEQHFHSMDAPVIGFPVLPVMVATYATRFNAIREFYIKAIEERSEMPEARDAVQDTLKWLKAREWGTED